MKIPSLKSTFPKISRAIQNYRYTKHQTELNRLVDLSGAFYEPHKELIGAQEVLANYAKAKNITMGFNNMLLKNSMDITVTHKNGKQVKATINGDVDAVETVERHRKLMLEDKDGLNYEAIGIDSHEDNFLKRVYRTVETLTKSIS